MKISISNCHPERLFSGAKDLALSDIPTALFAHERVSGGAEPALSEVEGALALHLTAHEMSVGFSR